MTAEVNHHPLTSLPLRASPTTGVHLQFRQTALTVQSIQWRASQQAIGVRSRKRGSQLRKQRSPKKCSGVGSWRRGSGREGLGHWPCCYCSESENTACCIDQLLCMNESFPFVCTAAVSSGRTTEHYIVTMRISIILCCCCCCWSYGCHINYDCLRQLAQTIFPALYASCCCLTAFSAAAEVHNSDLTTGQLFVVDAQPGSQGAEALSEPGSPAKEGGFRILGHLKGALKPPVSSKDA